MARKNESADEVNDSLAKLHKAEILWGLLEKKLRTEMDAESSSVGELSQAYMDFLTSTSDLMDLRNKVLQHMNQMLK